MQREDEAHRPRKN